jgi:menaquinone-specific isochorismate synthase
MSEFLTKETENFSGYLSENFPAIKNKNGGIFSYVIELPGENINFNPDASLNRFNTSYYFEKPDRSYMIYAADPVLELNDNGEGRFAVIDKKIKELKKNLFVHSDNKELPLFVGGMKFSVEHSDADWKEFNDSSWFIPECMLVISNKKSYFCFNAVIPFPKEATIKKFKQKLAFFLDQPADEFNFAQRVSTLTGSTPKDKKKWRNLVCTSLDKITAAEVDKVVLSRIVELRLLDELSFNFVLEKFRKKFSNCYLFIYKKNRSVFFGAAPELLANFRNGIVELDALAGSKPRGRTEEEDNNFQKELFSDEKILNEHSFVVKHLNNSLSNFLTEIVTEEPEVLKLDNIQHILTRLSGYLKDNNTMFNLLKEVFPTPAVCGYPKEQALPLIKKLEEHQRGLYSGITGWYNLNGYGEFVVAIRSALYSNKKLLAYAGSGIVETSNPEEEFKETELKLQSIISLFNEN